jgi:hypothetical protein
MPEKKTTAAFIEPMLLLRTERLWIVSSHETQEHAVFVCILLRVVGNKD